MSEIRQGRNRFIKHVIAKDVVVKIEDELRMLETTDPPPEPPKEIYTFADVLRENFEIFESIKNKRHKTEAISSIFQKHNLNITPASINAYMSRIRRELREKEETNKGYTLNQNKKEVKRKTKLRIIPDITLPTWDNDPTSTTDSNKIVVVDLVESAKEENTIVRNELHNEDVNTSVAEPCNSTINAGNAEQDNEPVKPLVAVQSKRKDNF